MVNLTTALNGNTYSSLWACSSNVPLNTPSVIQAMQVTFTHKILGILSCSCGQSCFSSCITVFLIHLWPPARYKWELGWWLSVASYLIRRWKSAWVEMLTPPNLDLGRGLFPLTTGGYAIRLFSSSLENPTALQKYIQRHFRNFKLDFPYSWWNTWTNLQYLCYSCDYLSWLRSFVLTLKCSAAQLRFNFGNISKKYIVFCMYFCIFYFSFTCRTSGILICCR